MRLISEKLFDGYPSYNDSKKSIEIYRGNKLVHRIPLRLLKINDMRAVLCRFRGAFFELNGYDVFYSITNSYCPFTEIDFVAKKGYKRIFIKNLSSKFQLSDSKYWKTQNSLYNKLRNIYTFYKFKTVVAFDLLNGSLKKTIKQIEKEMYRDIGIPPFFVDWTTN